LESPQTKTLPTLQPNTFTASLPERVFRRFLDLLAAFCVLFFGWPVFAFIAWRIRQDSPGPVFYRGLRAGRFAKPFHILKFRTMYEEPASYLGASVTAENDARITPLGKFLRDSKLNELPQFWNVLVGEMSLVGPRPEDVDIAALWPEDLRRVVLSVRPGITSPASILYRSEEKLLQHENVMETYLRSIQPSKLRLDSLYVRNRTLLSDIDLIFWTAIALLPGLRNRPIAETRLFWGPLARFYARFANWFLVDTLIVFAASLVSELIWRTSMPINIGTKNAILVAFLIGLLFSLINTLLGTNRVTWSRAAAADVLFLGVSAFFSTALLILAKRFWLDESVLPVGLILTSGILSFIGFVVVRYRERLITGTASRWMHIRSGARPISERVLIVGAGDNGELAIWLFSRQRMAHAFTVCGILDDDPRKQGMRVNGVEVLGTTNQLEEIAAREDIGLIVYTIYNIAPAERFKIIQRCHHTRARLVVLPDVMTQLAGEEHISPDFAALDRDGLTNASLTRYLAELEYLSRSGNLDAVHDLVTHLQSLIEKESS
jgi:lipopolysaccharide/colanic/teichoic acid biosynthesis glycosyltransferase